MFTSKFPHTACVFRIWKRPTLQIFIGISWNPLSPSRNLLPLSLENSARSPNDTYTHELPDKSFCRRRMELRREREGDRGGEKWRP